MAAVPFGLFLVLQGRYYYPAPIYPMLIAAGSCWLERRSAAWSGRRLTWSRIWRYGSLVVSSILLMAVVFPLAPVNSIWWQVNAALNTEIRNEIGWPELVQTIAGIRSSLPVSEQAGVGILAFSYGEAGAVDLYGPAYGLHSAISGMDTYWLRGYGDPPPQTLIVVGFSQQDESQIFQSCQVAGHISNRNGIMNDEISNNPDILVCRNLRQPWPQFWKDFQYFG
jgi:hypothetical protein